VLAFVRALGCVVEDDPEDPGQVFATLSLPEGARSVARFAAR
jgi:hypothetical protein